MCTNHYTVLILLITNLQREEKTLSATIEKGMPDGEDIVFKYESEQKPGQARHAQGGKRRDQA